jgi:hypothetical protein
MLFTFIETSIDYKGNVSSLDTTYLIGKIPVEYINFLTIGAFPTNLPLSAII